MLQAIMLTGKGSIIAIEHGVALHHAQRSWGRRDLDAGEADEGAAEVLEGMADDILQLAAVRCEGGVSTDSTWTGGTLAPRQPKPKQQTAGEM
jgi:hypothetical protein